MAKRIGVEIFIVLTIGLLLGLIGPFGTFAMPTAMRLGYWMIFGLAGYAIFRPLIILGKWMSETLAVSQLIGVGISIAVAAMPMTLLVALMLSGFNINQALRWQGIGVLYFQVCLIGLLVYSLMHMLFRDANRPNSASMDHAPATPLIQAEKQSAPAKGFAERLPAGLGPLLALKGEDHYVRAIGTMKDELLLIRLRDAVAELGEATGYQVHRSWWVAHVAVQSVERQGRNATLLLTNGIKVPISREYVARLKAAGWM
jgi:hypothetical protein